MNDRCQADAEHYVTLFDHRFLPLGMALHASLMEHAAPFHLWIVCMDSEAEEQLRRISLRNTSLLPLSEVETADLKAAKANRGWGEYCWTLSPFTFDWVLSRCADARRVTYLDADVFFFRPPAAFFKELDESGKSVLITEHAFPPESRGKEAEFGKHCVQFLTLGRSGESAAIRAEWAANCLANCSVNKSDVTRKFGDQQYLDDWPAQYPDSVHVLHAREQTLAPWNVDYYMRAAGKPYFPVMYHYHQLRIVSPHFIRLCQGYNIKRAKDLYAEYLNSLKTQYAKLAGNGIPVPVSGLSDMKFWLLRQARQVLFNRARFGHINWKSK